MDAILAAVLGFVHLLEGLVTAIEWLAIFIVATLIFISVLPAGNPLRETLRALCRRLMMTLGATVVAVPVQALPGVDTLYDIGAPLILACVWFTFVRDVMRSGKPLIVPPRRFSPPRTRQDTRGNLQRYRPEREAQGQIRQRHPIDIDLSDEIETAELAQPVSTPRDNLLERAK